MVATAANTAKYKTVRLKVDTYLRVKQLAATKTYMGYGVTELVDALLEYALDAYESHVTTMSVVSAVPTAAPPVTALHGPVAAPAGHDDDDPYDS